MSAAGDTLVPNQYTKPVFSRNGQRLISGVAPIIAPDDTTIVDFENPALDIWRWDAPMTPPQELKNVGKVREKNYPVVIDLGTMHQTLVYSAPLATAEGADRWDGDWALVKDPTADAVEGQWNYFSPVEISLVNVNDGRKRVLGKVPAGIATLSPGGKYVTWFDDRNYYSYNISTGDTVNMTASMPVLVWNDEDDHPMPAEPWGEACWSADDEAMLIYDKFDIWAVDPQGKRKPECVTGGEGRKLTVKRFTHLRVGMPVKHCQRRLHIFSIDSSRETVVFVGIVKHFKEHLSAAFYKSLFRVCLQITETKVAFASFAAGHALRFPLSLRLQMRTHR